MQKWGCPLLCNNLNENGWISTNQIYDNLNQCHYDMGSLETIGGPTSSKGKKKIESLDHGSSHFQVWKAKSLTTRCASFYTNM